MKKEFEFKWKNYCQNSLMLATEGEYTWME